MRKRTEFIADIQALLDKGLYPAQAAKRLGVTRNIVNNVIQRHRLKVTVRGNDAKSRGEWSKPMTAPVQRDGYLDRLVRDRTKSILAASEPSFSRFLDKRGKAA